jgi:hypothetical protein
MADAPEEILHPGTRALFRYWESLRGEGSAPDRSQLDLRPIRAYLSCLYIIEEQPPRGHRWRLAGTGICQIWKRELTGTPAIAGLDRLEMDTVARLLNGVIRAHQPFVLRLRLITSLSQELGAEMIALPVHDARLSRTVVFGAVMPFRDINLMGYESISETSITTSRVIWTEHGGDRQFPLFGRRRLTVIPGGRAD